MTGLSEAMLNIYERVYGLAHIAVADNETQYTLLSKALAPMLSHINRKKVKYLIHAHTSALIEPSSEYTLKQIARFYGLEHAICYGTTQYKCVSALKVMSYLKHLLRDPAEQCAILLIGEICYTPAIRVVPNCSIAGDAAVAIEISNQALHHQLIAEEIRYIPGYSEGIYLSADKLKQFDQAYMQIINAVMLCALAKAKLNLDSIKMILPHNVSYPAWKKIAIAIGFPYEKIYTDNIKKYGHCFSADHFINLHSAVNEGLLQPGDYYLMIGCGIGFYIGCTVFRY